MPTTYTVEYAKSGRAGCKKCKDKIGKDEIRIGALADGGDMGFPIQAWYHPKCFTLPKKCTIDDFMDSMLEDTSDGGEILPEKREIIMADIETKTPKKAKPGDPYLDSLKAAYEELQEADGTNDKKKKKRKKKGDDDDEEEEDEPAKKKAKKVKDVDPVALEQYGKHHKMGLEELKDILRWNRQVLVGTKPIVLRKVLDGAINGRLAVCGICGGKLKWKVDPASAAFSQVLCNGTFDEEMSAKIPCSVTYKPDEAPRFKPWFEEAPTEEEEKAMDAAEAAAKGEEEEVDPSNVDDDSDLGQLIIAAKKLDLDFSTTDKAIIKANAKKMIELLQENGKLDLPDDEKKVRMDVGKLLVGSKEDTVNEICAALVKKFGWKAAKEAKAAKKEQAVSGGCVVEANGPLVAAFEELANLHFKEGEQHAGVANKKVTAALKALPFEVTKENAPKLAKKGKDKVENIGASSAKKMVEFLTTGTMEKLEEKRANLA